MLRSNRQIQHLDLRFVQRARRRKKRKLQPQYSYWYQPDNSVLAISLTGLFIAVIIFSIKFIDCCNKDPENEKNNGGKKP